MRFLGRHPVVSYNPGMDAPGMNSPRAAAPLLIVVNRAAGSGRAGSRWKPVPRELSRRTLVFAPAFTNKAGDAPRLAEQAARDGRSGVVAVGGDGTINEVVNGL